MRKRSTGRLALALLVISMPAVSVPVQAAEDWEQFTTERWYRVEVVIFERPQVSAFSPEAKPNDWSGTPDRWYPAHMQAFRLAPDDARRRYPIRGDGCISSGRGSNRLSEFGDRTRDTRRPAKETPTHKRANKPKPRAKVPPELAFLKQQIEELEAAYYESSYRWLRPDVWQLRPHASALERRGGMNVLFHGAWHQPVPKRSEPSPMLFHQGPQIDAHQRLEGTLGVTVGRYLHFHAQLWLHSTGGYAAPPAVDPTLGATVEPGATSELGSFQSAIGGSYVELNESRRMRSGELNYLDHPNFGILVKIEPLDIEADLASLPPPTG